MRLSTRAVNVRVEGGQKFVDLVSDDYHSTIAVDAILTGAGRVPSVDGLDLEAAADKVDIRATRRGAAHERLAALESGEEEPTRAILINMAKQYQRHLRTFSLAQPPRRGERAQEFRHRTDGSSAQRHAVIGSLVRERV